MVPFPDPKMITRIKIDGLIEKPIEIDADELISMMGTIEERIYRHRCVEAWAMTLPWSGFEFSKLIDFAKQQANPMLRTHQSLGGANDAYVVPHEPSQLVPVVRNDDVFV